MLLTVSNVLDGAELAQARTLLAGADWSDGRGTAGAQAREAKNNQQLAPDSDAARALRPVVLRALDRNALLFSAALPKRVLPPAFNRYGGATNAYGAHVDNAIRHAHDSGQRVRTDISCTLFLSEPGDYDGGELVIRDAGGQQAIKLGAGDLVCYPGTSVHDVTPVTRGERLAAFFWIESLVRSAEQRRLLFDLDQALIALRARGEHGEAVTLTGIYHNLLRMWADT